MSKNFKNRNLVISDIFYFIPGRGAKYCDKRVSVSVCLSVCLFAGVSQNDDPNFTKLSARVNWCGCGLVLLWREINTLCTSGNKMFAHRPESGDATIAIHWQWHIRDSIGSELAKLGAYVVNS